MTRNQMADHLIEVRRYTRKDPDYVRSLLSKLNLGKFTASTRLEQNIQIGAEYLLVDPQVLESYLYAAAFELRMGEEAGS